MQKIKNLLLFATSVTVVSLTGFSVAVAQEATVISTIGEWRVAMDDVACWISTEANFVTHDDLRLPNPIMNVAFFLGNHNPEISFSAPDCCELDVSAYTDGYNMPLTLYEYTLFSKREDELDFLLSLLKSSYVDIKTDVNDERIMSFSLAGFRDAYNEVSRICKFHSLDLEDANGAQLG